MQTFFAPRWQELARLAVHNFFSEVLPQTPLPTLLQLQADRAAMQRSVADAAALRRENDTLRWQLEVAEAQVSGSAHAGKLQGQSEAHAEEGVELVEIQAGEAASVHSSASDS